MSTTKARVALWNKYTTSDITQYARLLEQYLLAALDVVDAAEECYRGLKDGDVPMIMRDALARFKEIADE